MNGKGGVIVEALTLNPYVGLKKDAQHLVAAMFSNRQEIALAYDPALEKLLKIAEDTPSDTWLEHLRKDFDISNQDYQDSINTLRELGILVPSDYVPKNDTVYARQDAYFVGMGLNGKLIRERLSNAVVMVLGCGGIGGNLIEQLCAMGVSNFVLVDDDRVELSNMNRSLIYRFEDVGELKTDVLSRWIEYRCSDPTVVTYHKRITNAEDISDVLRRHSDISLVLDCMDKPDKYTTSVWVSQACWSRGIPHFICGGYHLHGGLIGQTCIPPVTACAMCYVSDYEKDRFTGLRIPPLSGSFMPVVRLVSSLQCMEVFRLLTSYEEPIYKNKTYNVNFAKMDFREIPISKNSACPICSGRG